MRGAAFRDWLDGQYTPESASSRASRAARVEGAYGDLDAHFARDRLATVIAQLEYTAEDEALVRPNMSRIVINGNLRNGLASLKRAVRCYQEFAQWQRSGEEG